MRYILLLLGAMGLVGCATQRSSVTARSPQPSPTPVVAEATVLHDVETRYDLRTYCDANDPSVRHEPHAVYRVTRVPKPIEALEVAPREHFSPVTYAPLPNNTELEAELATQRQLTAQLREIQARMSAVEAQARTQYSALVGETAGTVKLRQELEEERARVRELESKLHDRVANSEGGGGSGTGEVKW